MEPKMAGTQKKAAMKSSSGAKAATSAATQVLGEVEASCRELVAGLGEVTFLKSVHSSVTTGWGVRWNEEMVARDLMQNVRDGNKDRMGEIRTRQSGDAVSLFGPSTFDLQRLYYIGSQKSAEAGDVGQYGEGFKAACIALLRDFFVRVVVISGSSIVRIRLSDTVVDGTDMRPLEYDFFEHDGSVEGSHLIVQGAKKSLAKELMTSLRHFIWSGNELLGDLVFESHQAKIYRSTGKDGAGFYRGILRMTLKDVPFVMVVENVVKSIDKKIEQDRDRKSFDDAVSDTFLKYALKSANVEFANLALQATKALWSAGIGVPILRVIGENVFGAYHEVSKGRLISIRRAFSAIGDHDQFIATSHSDKPDVFAKRRQLESEGRKTVPRYFRAFGVTTAEDVLKLEEQEHNEAIRSAANTRPTETEQEAINVLIEAVDELSSGELRHLTRGRDFNYMIAHTDEILGMLKSERGYRSSTVVLAAEVFERSFSMAMSVVLHEMGHVFGYDGSRHFSDALTRMIEHAIDGAGKIDKSKKQWDEIRERIIVERSAISGSVIDRFMKMPNDQLRTLIRSCDETLLLQIEGASFEDAQKAAMASANVRSQWMQKISAGSPKEVALRAVSEIIDRLPESFNELLAKYSRVDGLQGSGSGSVKRFAVELRPFDPEIYTGYEKLSCEVVVFQSNEGGEKETRIFTTGFRGGDGWEIEFDQEPFHGQVVNGFKNSDEIHEYQQEFIVIRIDELPRMPEELISVLAGAMQSWLCRPVYFISEDSERFISPIWPNGIVQNSEGWPSLSFFAEGQPD